MNFPVNVSLEALEQLKRLLDRKGGEGSFIRIGVKGGGCSGLEYVIKVDDRPLPNDLRLESENVRLVCDAKSAEYLNGATLKWTGNLIGNGFEFVNPNAQRSCGCGTSFFPKQD